MLFPYLKRLVPWCTLLCDPSTLHQVGQLFVKLLHKLSRLLHIVPHFTYSLGPHHAMTHRAVYNVHSTVLEFGAAVIYTMICRMQL